MKGMLGAALAMVMAGAQAQITGFEVKRVGDGLTVKVQGMDLPRPKVTRVGTSKATVLEFDTELAIRPRRVTVRHAGVQWVQIGWFTSKPPKVRVTLYSPTNPVTALQMVDGTAMLSVGAPALALKTPAAPPTVAAATPKAKPVAKPTPPKAVAQKVDLFPTSVPPLEPAPKPKPSATPPAPVEQVQLLPAVASEAPKAPVQEAPMKEAPVKEAPMQESPAKAAVKPAPKAEPFPTRVPPLEPAPRPRNAVGVAVDTAKLIAQAPATTVTPAPRPVSPATGMVTLDFNDVDVRLILKAMALQSGRNIVAVLDEKTTTKVSIALRDVSVTQALNIVTGLAGLKYTEQDGVYFVGPAANVDALTGKSASVEFAPETRVVPVAPGYGQTIQTAIKQAFPATTPKGPFDIVVRSEAALANQGNNNQGNGDRGGGTSNQRAQAPVRQPDILIISGSPARVAEISVAIAKLDEQLTALRGTRPDEVTEVVDLRFVQPPFAQLALLRAYPSLGVFLMPVPLDPRVGVQVDESVDSRPTQDQSQQRGGAEGGQGGGQGGGGATPATTGGTEQSGTRQLSGSGEAKGWSVRTNSLPMKLLLVGRKEEISGAKELLTKVDIAPKQVAFEMRVMSITREEALRVGIDWTLLTGSRLSTIRFNNTLGDSTSQAGTNTGAYIIDREGRVDWSATLDQIANKTNLIARPNVLALDGTPSGVFIGDTIRYIKSLQSTQSGVTAEIDFIRVGVDMALVARVGSDGTITVTLNPRVSNLVGFETVPGGGRLPQTTERETFSTFRVNDGETIALGGLIQDTDRRRESGVPFLKDLPIIGKLFSRTDNQRVRNEIVFFLTAKVVDDEFGADPRRNDPLVPQRPGPGMLIPDPKPKKQAGKKNGGN